MPDEIKIKDKDIVVPGEVLAVGKQFIGSKGTYREEDKIIASRLGVISIERDLIKLIPVSGRYIPKVNDKVIGRVIDLFLSGWQLDINSPYTANLSLKEATSEFVQKGADLRRYFEIGDNVVVGIFNVTSQKLVDVTTRSPGLKKLIGGRIIYVNPFKVPRIIGKEGSMVTLIKQMTGCNIVVGQNGVVWIDGEPEGELLAVEAIRKVEEESHLSELTDRVSKFLEKKTEKK